MAPDKHPGNGIDRHGNSATPALHQNKYIDYTEKWGPFRMRTVHPWPSTTSIRTHFWWGEFRWKWKQMLHRFPRATHNSRRFRHETAFGSLYVEELWLKAVPGSGSVLNASAASNCSAKLLLVLKTMKIEQKIMSYSERRILCTHIRNFPSYVHHSCC